MPRDVVRHWVRMVAATAALAFAGALSPVQAADSDTTPMRFHVVASGADCPGCVVINAQGEITDDTSRDFSVFVANARLKGILPRSAARAGAGAPSAARQPRVLVAFSSIGGKVVPALVIGRRLREFGWTSLVGQARRGADGVAFDPAGCYSACSMVMLGGVERFIVPGSREGLHQFQPVFGPRETFDAGAMNDIVRDYARQVVGVYDYVAEMGVDVGFFVTTLRTPFSGMDIVPRDRWKTLGLVTALLPEDGETTLASVLQVAPPGAAPVASAAPAPEPRTALDPHGALTPQGQGH